MCDGYFSSWINWIVSRCPPITCRSDCIAPLKMVFIDSLTTPNANNTELKWGIWFSHLAFVYETHRFFRSVWVSSIAEGYSWAILTKFHSKMWNYSIRITVLSLEVYNLVSIGIECWKAYPSILCHVKVMVIDVEIVFSEPLMIDFKFKNFVLTLEVNDVFS